MGQNVCFIICFIPKSILGNHIVASVCKIPKCDTIQIFFLLLDVSLWQLTQRSHGSKNISLLVMDPLKRLNCYIGNVKERQRIVIRHLAAIIILSISVLYNS